MNSNPPKYSKWILKRFLIRYSKSPALGDLDEEFTLLADEVGLRRARYWYGRQVLMSIPSFLNHIIYWSLAMLKNYLKTAFRNLKKQKMYSAITLTGLAVGFGIFLFFFRVIVWALSADHFHKDVDNIYSVVQVFDSGGEGERHSAFVPHPLIPVLKNEIPEIEEATCFFSPGRMVVERKDKKFYEGGILFVDPNFLSFFTFNAISGNPEVMLSEPNAIVLTRSTAMKYFGDESPVGKVLTLNNTRDVTITGIVEDIENIPSLSTVRFTFLASGATARSLFGSTEEWADASHTGFVRLTDGTNPKVLEGKLERILHRHYSDAPDSPKRMYLFPMLDFAFQARHIHAYFTSDLLLFYIMFFIMGTLFLLIVTVNFINLSTAKYTDRLKEVGLRKVVGAHRTQLIWQFLGESVLMTLIALPLAILAYSTICSAITAYIGGIFFNLSLWKSPTTLFALIAVSILTGILAGLYPALFLSSFRPAQALKKKFKTRKGRGRLRRFLVVFQFAISAVLIVLAIVWKRQANYVYKVDLGYDRSGVVVVPLSDVERENYHLLKGKLRHRPEISSVSASVSLPGSWRTKERIIPDGMSSDEGRTIYTYGIGYDFTDVMNIRMVMGRDFSKDFRDEDRFIINELTVQEFGWDDPIGKSLTVGGRKGAVIGVVEDFHFDKLYYPMGPTVLYLEQKHLNYMLVKASDVSDAQTVVETIKSHWNIYNPNVPFEFYILEDHFQRVYFGLTTLSTLIMGNLGGIAVFFSCLGLLGLASYSVRQRTKEIGIRKVLGASVSNILRILGWDFFKLVVLANVIALPVAYVVSKRLLEFAYILRIPIGSDVFFLSIFITLLTAIVAVVSQTIKAALANPVDTLRYE